MPLAFLYGRRWHTFQQGGDCRLCLSFKGRAYPLPTVKEGGWYVLCLPLSKETACRPARMLMQPQEFSGLPDIERVHALPCDNTLFFALPVWRDFFVIGAF